MADRIAQAFEASGISYFIDRQGISGGMEFPEVLANAILASKIFLFLASENSYKSKFTQSEIVFAFNKKQKEDIIPYIIDDSTLPTSLELTFSSINWRNMSQHPIATIVADIRRKIGPYCEHCGKKVNDLEELSCVLDRASSVDEPLSSLRARNKCYKLSKSSHPYDYKEYVNKLIKDNYPKIFEKCKIDIRYLRKYLILLIIGLGCICVACCVQVETMTVINYLTGIGYHSVCVDWIDWSAGIWKPYPVHYTCARIFLVCFIIALYALISLAFRKRWYRRQLSRLNF